MSGKVSMFERQRVSRAVFEEKVIETARQNWQRRLELTAKLDWEQAEDELRAEMWGRSSFTPIPTIRVMARAEDIFSKREPQRTVADWLNAVEYMAKYYEVE